MPQTDVRVVRCPKCNAAYNAASLAPGKSFRCKKCSSVIGGSAPEPAASRAVEKKPTSRLDRKSPATSTSRRPGSGASKSTSRMDRRQKDEVERGTGRSGRGEKPAAKKNPLPLYIGGGVVLLLLIIVVAVNNKGDEKKPAQQKKADTTKVEQPKTDKGPEPTAFDKAFENDHSGGETEFAKQRRMGSHGQSGNTPDPTAGKEPPADPNAQKPPDAPAKDPLDQEAEKKDNK